MNSWWTVLVELLGMLPALVEWLRERKADQKAALLEYIEKRDMAWKDEDATRIINSVRRGDY